MTIIFIPFCDYCLFKARLMKKIWIYLKNAKNKQILLKYMTKFSKVHDKKEKARLKASSFFFMDINPSKKTAINSLGPTDGL